MGELFADKMYDLCLLCDRRSDCLALNIVPLKEGCGLDKVA